MSGATAEFDLQEQLARIKHTQTLIDLHVEETRNYISEARKLDAEQAKFNAIDVERYDPARLPDAGAALPQSPARILCGRRS